MTRVHAFSADDALSDLDATGLVEAYRAGTVSMPEVIDAAIARTEQVDPALGAVAHRAYDRARAEALDPRPGWFAGVPTFVKDNVDVEGMPTQHGADAFRAQPAKTDGDFARMYLATGLVPLGKTQLSEFGFSGAADHVRLGPVRSPWHTDHYAGASSAGSAALVAAGAVPIAHANDGGGSIRIPAAVNGLVGLKPTRGRLAQDRMMREMPVRIVSDGVLTRSVRDTAAFYREAEKVWRNPLLAPIGDITRPGRARLRIAVVTQGIGRDSSPEVRELTLRTAALLEGLGHHVEEIDNPVPASFPDHFVRFWSLLAYVIAKRGRKDYGDTFDPSKLDNLTLGLARHAGRNLHKQPFSIAVLRASRRVAAQHRQAYDVTLTPTLATETPRVGHLRPDQDYDEIMTRLMDWVAFTPLQNATGEPAISLPLATTAAGLPHGMMLGAGAGREARLLGLAYELEEAVGWPRIHDSADAAKAVS
ncbi:amidase [Nocardioides baculatus]|uniref:Amidase n=1 Tax=Nocardioides baculatus TaxID=2801337 RepID=A0ABS1L2W3_9ACTN|nr:amidase [Nocardioides baculatus]MBL0746035.1 amidase [Nocardioides baculatus]